MKKLYQITYALLVTCGSLYAQNVTQTNTEPDIAKNQTVENMPQTNPALERGEHELTNIGLSAEVKRNVAGLLHVLLANEYALYAKTQKYHWNVKGEFFGPLHSLFQKQYESLAEIIDQVAERSLALGIPSVGGLQELASLMTIEKETNQNTDDVAMIKQLLTDHEMIIRQLRTDIDTTATLRDMGTNNFLSDLISKHEKMAWMLRAHLQ
jgi:starvation-inducible DNA-binding protein